MRVDSSMRELWIASSRSCARRWRTCSAANCRSAAKRRCPRAGARTPSRSSLVTARSIHGTRMRMEAVRRKRNVVVSGAIRRRPRLGLVQRATGDAPIPPSGAANHLARRLVDHGRAPLIDEPTRLNAVAPTIRTLLGGPFIADGIVNEGLQSFATRGRARLAETSAERHSLDSLFLDVRRASFPRQIDERAVALFAEFAKFPDGRALVGRKGDSANSANSAKGFPRIALRFRASHAVGVARLDGLREATIDDPREEVSGWMEHDIIRCLALLRPRNLPAKSAEFAKMLAGRPPNAPKTEFREFCGFC